MVVQKNAPGFSEVSLMAKITVKTNITTSMKIDHTIRVVKLPLKQIIRQAANK